MNDYENRLQKMGFSEREIYYIVMAAEKENLNPVTIGEYIRSWDLKPHFYSDGITYSAHYHCWSGIDHRFQYFGIKRIE